MSIDRRGGSSGWSALTRREAIGSLTAGISGVAVAAAAEPSPPGRPRIAAVVTEYYKTSHAQGIVDRFLEGFGWQGKHHVPPVEIVSLYVDQKRAGDLSREPPGDIRASPSRPRLPKP